jgi:hypothetical protein
MIIYFYNYYTAKPPIVKFYPTLPPKKIRHLAAADFPKNGLRKKDRYKEVSTAKGAAHGFRFPFTTISYIWILNNTSQK